MVEQNSVFLSNSDVLHSTMFCVIIAPLVDRKKSKLSRKREKEKKDIVSGLVILLKGFMVIVVQTKWSLVIVVLIMVVR